MAVDNRVGASLKALRESVALSVESLADRAGLPASVLADIEQGVRIPSASQVARITAATAAELQAVTVSDDDHRLRAERHGHPSTGWDEGGTDEH